MRDQLLKLREQLDGIAGQWDGDKPGKLEELATTAAEARTHVDKLITLLDELELFTNN